MGAGRGYGAVLAERPVRRLLAASLAGRLAFSMLPLAFVLFATARTHSAAVAGAVVAAFSVTSMLAPVRGRIVDHRGPPALVAFAVGCAGALIALIAAGAAGAPAAVLVVVGGLAGLAVPPLGPFTRAVWGGALGAYGERLQRVYALDSAGEEASDILAPLLVALVVFAVSPGAALGLAAAGLLAGTAAAAGNPLTRQLAPAADAPRARVRLSGALWLIIAALAGPGAAIGAITVAVPAFAREAGTPAAAGLVMAAFALGSPVAGLLAGRSGWRGPPGLRLAALGTILAGALALAAAIRGDLVPLAGLLVVAGMALGALVVTVYVLVDELTPAGAATRTFAWLVTANNGGIALGAVLAGELVRSGGARSGLWLAAGSALVGVPVALAFGSARPHSDIGGASSGPDP